MGSKTPMLAGYVNARELLHPYLRGIEAMAMLDLAALESAHAEEIARLTGIIKRMGDSLNKVTAERDAWAITADKERALFESTRGKHAEEIAALKAKMAMLEAEHQGALALITEMNEAALGQEKKMATMVCGTCANSGVVFENRYDMQTVSCPVCQPKKEG